MDSPTIDAALAQAGLFRHLLGSAVQLPPDLQSTEPVEPATIALWLSEGWLTRTEVLSIYAYLHFAAKLEPALAERIKELQTALGVSRHFAHKCEESWTTRLSKIGAMTVESLLAETPAEVTKSVYQLAVSERRQRQRQPRARLSGLQAIVFQHPADRVALAALSAIPVMPKIMGKVVDLLKTADQVQLMGGAVAVTSHSLPTLHGCFREACEVLAIDPVPQLFIEEGSLGAYTTGVEAPYVVLTSAAATLLTREELLFVLGHELGHIKAAHVKYQSLGRALRYAGIGAAAVTQGLSFLLANELTLLPLLSQWSRKSEFTADRAGLLACQDQEVALRTMLKLAGYPIGQYTRLHPRFIVAQAAAFRDRLSDSLFSRAMSLSNLWQASHPYLVLRAWELLDWLQDGTAEDLIQADSAGRRHMANTAQQDPQLAELELAVIRTVSDWVVANLHLPRNRVRRVLRCMINQGASARNTEMEPVLQIQLSITKASADHIDYLVYLVVNRNGRPTRVTLPMCFDAAWDQVPTCLRGEFIRSGQRELVRELYSIR